MNKRNNRVKKDPDNDPKLSDDDRTMLSFTKLQRYELGKTMAIGTKEEIKKAKTELENIVTSVINMKIDSKS